MNNRAIAHMDLDSFFVSVERLHNKKLEGKPVIIGGTGDRGVVSSCSYEARSFGVSSAMPTKMAKELCPDAHFIRGDMERYSYHSRVVTEIITAKVPLVEKSSIDEFYIDLTGMDRFFGCYRWASEMRQDIQKKAQLPISFGLSTSKTVSKVATGEAKPKGQIQVEGGKEKQFMAPLSIQKIPMVGAQTYRLLRSMGIARVHTLQSMDAGLLEQAMGKQGIALWKKANGIDNSPVVPYHENKSISTERTFHQDTTDVHKLEGLLVAMAEKVAFQLRKSNKLCSCITVKIRYSNFDTHTLQARIPYSSCDHLIIAKVKALFHRLYNRRIRIRLVGVRLSKLTEGGHQINLFEDTEDMISLYQAMDSIRKRFGNKAVTRAVGMNERLNRINPFQAA